MQERKDPVRGELVGDSRGDSGELFFFVSGLEGQGDECGRGESKKTKVGCDHSFLPPKMGLQMRFGQGMSRKNLLSYSVNGSGWMAVGVANQILVCSSATVFSTIKL